MNITLDPIYGEDPCPRVVIEVQDVPVGAVTTITYLTGGERVVQDARRRPDSAYVVTDYAAAFGIPIEYRVEAHIDGALVEAETLSTTIPDPHARNYDRGWMQLPLAPTSAVEVWWGEGALQSWGMDGVDSIEAPIGPGDPFGFGAALTQTKDIPVTWHGIGVDTIHAVESMLRTSRRPLVRLRDPIGLPPAAHLSLSRVFVLADDMDRDPAARIRTWSATAQIVRPPATNIAVPVYTFGAVAGMHEGQTFADVMATRPGSRFLDWVRDPRP